MCMSETDARISVNAVSVVNLPVQCLQYFKNPLNFDNYSVAFLFH